jgi:predicted Fe-Mo cluster-binding NifX family protein
VPRCPRRCVVHWRHAAFESAGISAVMSSQSWERFWRATSDKRIFACRAVGAGIQTARVAAALPKDGERDIHAHKTNIPMKIAIPVQDGRLHDHFGGCRHFAVVEIDSEKKSPIATDILATPEHQPGAFPRWLRGLGVDTVIAGGIGRRALAIFAQHGIVVRAGSSGAKVEELVAAYLGGQLKTAPDGCEHHQQDHGHEHGHEHGHPHHHHRHHREENLGEPGRSRP